MLAATYTNEAKIPQTSSAERRPPTPPRRPEVNSERGAGVAVVAMTLGGLHRARQHRVHELRDSEPARKCGARVGARTAMVLTLLSIET